MRIEDFDSECDVTKPADIEAALSKRHDGGINSFWLSHEAEEFPAINIMVKGGLAYVHYFPQERRAGFASVAEVPGPRPNETSALLLSPTEKIWVRNGALIPFSKAY